MAVEVVGAAEVSLVILAACFLSLQRVEATSMYYNYKL